jgi:hypothetical protein
MKTRHVVLTVIMLIAAATAVHAQEATQDMKKFTAGGKYRIDRNFVRALRTPNEGVVGSALAIVAKMRLERPSEELPLTVTEVHYLAVHSPTPSIRYRACLTEDVFWHPQRYKASGFTDVNDVDAFFSALEGVATTQALSSN